MRRSTIVFASAVAMVLASCTGGKSPVTNPSGGGSGGSNASPRHGGTLDLTAQDDLTILDNSQAVSPVDYELTAGALYDGLYHINHQGSLEPGLADGMPTISTDGLMYTIKLPAR